MIQAFNSNSANPYAYYIILLPGVCFPVGLYFIVSFICSFKRVKLCGIKADPQQHAALFKEMNSVLSAVHKKPDIEIYFDLKVNAGISQKKNKLVMVLGLPLVAISTVSELKSIIAHEYGHYANYDTRLALIMYKTYKKLEIRIQELAADRYAAELYGKKNLIDNLCKTAAVDRIFDTFYGEIKRLLFSHKILLPVSAGLFNILKDTEIDRMYKQRLNINISY